MKIDACIMQKYNQLLSNIHTPQSSFFIEALMTRAIVGETLAATESLDLKLHYVGQERLPNGLKRWK
jgi:hypothetical protein